MQRRLKNTPEDEWYDIGNIRDGVKLPLAGRAIIVVTNRAPFVFVMVHFANEQRHAQVEQANHDG